MVEARPLAHQFQGTGLPSKTMKKNEVEALWTIQVESYAGYRGEERPLRFQWGEESHDIIAVLDQWYGPEESFFKVRTSENETYVLGHSFSGVWTIESFSARQG